jgi:hypothetical protein
MQHEWEIELACAFCDHLSFSLQFTTPTTGQPSGNCLHLAAIDWSYHDSEIDDQYGTWTSSLAPPDALSLTLVAEEGGEERRFKTPHERLDDEIDGAEGEGGDVYLIVSVLFALEPADLYEESEQHVDDVVKGRTPLNRPNEPSDEN